VGLETGGSFLDALGQIFPLGPDTKNPVGWKLVFFSDAQPIQKHLFDGFVVRHQNMADRMAADEMANLLSQVLGMIAGALERLGHEDDL
jgi:hypothetical protein